jgi:hypothetical protein
MALPAAVHGKDALFCQALGKFIGSLFLFLSTATCLSTLSRVKIVLVVVFIATSMKLVVGL